MIRIFFILLIFIATRSRKPFGGQSPDLRVSFTKEFDITHRCLAMAYSAARLLGKRRRACETPAAIFLRAKMRPWSRARVIVFFFCFCSGATLVAQSARYPEYNRREERYWEELQAKQQEEARAAKRLEDE